MADMNEDNRQEETKYGGCEGPESMYIKLIAEDGHEFIIRRDHAVKVSKKIKDMLCGPGQSQENEISEVYLSEIPSHIVQKVCMYFTYKGKYTDSSTEIPPFLIEPKIALEVLMAANFLLC